MVSNFFAMFSLILDNALFPKSKAERRLAPSTVKISLLLCGRYLKREEVAGQVKVGLKFFHKVQKSALVL